MYTPRKSAGRGPHGKGRVGLITKKIDLDMMTLQDLFGIEDSNLRELEKELSVAVVTREGCAEIHGELQENVEIAAQVLRTLDKMRRVGEPMNAFAVTRALHFVRSGDPDGAVAAIAAIRYLDTL